MLNAAISKFEWWAEYAVELLLGLFSVASNAGAHSAAGAEIRTAGGASKLCCCEWVLGYVRTGFIHRISPSNEAQVGARLSAGANVRGVWVDHENNIYAAMDSTTVSVRKWNSGGVLLWTYALGDGNTAYAVETDSVGNVYVVCNASGTVGNEISLIKLNASGVKQWSVHTAPCLGISVKADDHIRIVGEPHAGGAAGDNAWTYDEDGNQIAAEGVGTTIGDLRPSLRDVVYDASGNEFITGSRDGDDYQLWRNTAQWAKLPVIADQGFNLSIDGDGAVWVAYAAINSGIRKLDSSGSTEWTYTTFGAFTQDIVTDDAGNGYFGGRPGVTKQRIKIDTDGNVVWSRDFSSGHIGAAHRSVREELPAGT